MLYSETEKYVIKTLDPMFKSAVCSYFSIVAYINAVNRHNFTAKILDEALVTNRIVFYFSKNFYLVDDFNKRLSQFKANGLIDLWMSKYISAEKSRPQDIPSSMNLRHLQGIFEILIYGLTVSLFAFLLELFSKIFLKIKIILR